MALEEKGMALGKRGMARHHAKRGWGKHYGCRAAYFERVIKKKSEYMHYNGDICFANCNFKSYLSLVLLSNIVFIALLMYRC